MNDHETADFAEPLAELGTDLQQDEQVSTELTDHSPSEDITVITGTILILLLYKLFNLSIIADHILGTRRLD